VDNATASINGCHLIVATKDVVSLMIEDLRKHNFMPEQIGFVSKKGSSSVAFAGKEGADPYVAAKAKLARLSSEQIPQPTPG